MKERLSVGHVDLIVQTAIPFYGADTDEVLQLAAAASCNGGDDPGDIALVRAARVQTEELPYAQRAGSWTPPSDERKYSTAWVKSEETGDCLEVARGDASALMDLCALPKEEREILFDRFEKHARHGYRPVGVAIRKEQGSWEFQGVVPLFAMRHVTNVQEARADFRYFMVWDWQLRILHWCWVLCVVGLAATGICIAEGWFLKTGDQTSGFQFGMIRFVHYGLAWVLVAILVLRFSCFFFASNKYQTFASLFPVQKKRWVDLFRTAVDYMCARSYDGPRYIGHNPLQQWTYTGVYVLFSVMVVTGFALYALYEPTQWFYKWFMPLNDWVGIPYIRLIHLVGMWCFLLFVTIHVYLSVLAGNVDRDGTISSMFSGGRWLRKSARFEDE